MFFNPNSSINCEVCGESRSLTSPCRNCDKIEKLKGLICPCCKGTNIYLSQSYANNGIIGPGCSSWVTSEHFVCLDCGVMFKRVKSKDKE